MGYSFEVDARPRVIMRCVGRVTDQEYAAHLAQYAAILAWQEPFGVVVDALNAKPLPASQRTLQARFLERHASAFRRHCVGEAFVITSPLTRAALKAILYVSPLPHSHVVVATIDEASRSIDGWLETRGVFVRGPGVVVPSAAD